MSDECTCLLCTTGRIFMANKKRLPKDVWAAINTLNCMMFDADMDCAKAQAQRDALLKAAKLALIGAEADGWDTYPAQSETPGFREFYEALKSAVADAEKADETKREGQP